MKIATGRKRTILLGAAGAALATLIHGQSAAPGFTASQAEQGRSAYAQNCASCHGQNLDDGEFAPAVKGAAFLQQWGGKSADGLFTYIGTSMPPANRGALSADTYAQIMAYLLSNNGVEPGTQALPSDAAQLKAMTMPGAAAPAARRGGPGGGLSPYAQLPPEPAKANPADKLTPVTDAMLRNPPVGEWLTWRRTWDDRGFSPLRQINRANVGDLRVAWTWSLPAGPNESTPLVHDGVIFVHGYGDNVQALDAQNGDLLWSYSRELPKDARASVKRNIALYGDRVLVATSDLHMVSLDAKTGKVAWDHEIAPHKDNRLRLTGGPLVAKGKVMVGTVGSIPGGNFIVALDVETGKEAWRFHSIAQPGETGGNTWNGLELEKRNGASVWVAGSYDPDLNLAYFGPAQTYDTGPLLHPVNQPGVTNDGLYTDTTVAINPDTGKVAWYFQHTPNDQWDFDWAFERQLINVPVNGVNKKLVVTAGKEAIYDALEADTGKYAFSMDLGLQNVVTAIDPKTGAKTINPKVMPGKGETLTVCPHAGGAKSWLPASWNQETKILYVPLVESCMDMIPVEGGRGSLTSGLRWSIRPPLETDGKYGRLEAINLATRKVVWTDRQRAPVTAGALATAGGVVFNGSIDRVVKAYDSANGKILWQTRLNDVPSSAPISYMVNGRQYVAVVVGNGGAQAATWPVLVPEIRNPPNGGAAIWVFELPGKDVAR